MAAIRLKRPCRAAAILEQLGLELPLDAYVRDLDIAVQQMIEIAKAVLAGRQC